MIINRNYAPRLLKLLLYSMANDGNDIGSLSSGANPMEKIMEKAVASFLQTLQNNVTNGLSKHHERPTTIKQFQDLKPFMFTGDSIAS